MTQDPLLSRRFGIWSRLSFFCWSPPSGREGATKARFKEKKKSKVCRAEWIETKKISSNFNCRGRFLEKPEDTDTREDASSHSHYLVMWNQFPRCAVQALMIILSSLLTISLWCLLGNRRKQTHQETCIHLSRIITPQYCFPRCHWQTELRSLLASQLLRAIPSQRFGFLLGSFQQKCNPKHSSQWLRKHWTRRLRGWQWRDR